MLDVVLRGKLREQGERHFDTGARTRRCDQTIGVDDRLIDELGAIAFQLRFSLTADLMVGRRTSAV